MNDIYEDIPFTFDDNRKSMEMRSISEKWPSVAPVAAVTAIVSSEQQIAPRHKELLISESNFTVDPDRFDGVPRWIKQMIIDDASIEADAQLLKRKSERRPSCICSCASMRSYSSF
jgi:hypothetical protein